jgi:hypothetical protein
MRRDPAANNHYTEEPATMPYIRKTRDEYTIQQYTGSQYGWEDVTAEDTRTEAIAQLRTYRENDRGGMYRMINRRISLEQDRRDLIAATLERINRHHGAGSIVDVTYSAAGGTVTVRKQYGRSTYRYSLLEGNRIRYRGITRTLGYTLRYRRRQAS